MNVGASDRHDMHLLHDNVVHNRYLFMGAMALKAYPDGCTYLYWESGDVLNNTLYRSARETILYCGFAMIPLPSTR